MQAGPQHFGGDLGSRGNPQLFLVTAEVMHAVTVSGEHLGDQQAELAVAEHRHLRVAGEPHLIENLASSREWF